MPPAPLEVLVSPYLLFLPDTEVPGHWPELQEDCHTTPASPPSHSGCHTTPASPPGHSGCHTTPASPPGHSGWPSCGSAGQLGDSERRPAGSGGFSLDSLNCRSYHLSLSGFPGLASSLSSENRGQDRSRLTRPLGQSAPAGGGNILDRVFVCMEQHFMQD